MPADLHASGYLVDGVALAATGVTLTHDGSGLYVGAGEDVNVITYPGKDGGNLDEGSFRPYTHSTMYTVRAAGGFDAVWAAIRGLRRRCKPGRTVTVTRVMPDPDGTDANTSHTTTARRQGPPRVEWLGASAATVDLDWLVTEPWHGPSTTIASGAGTQTILGDIRTNRMTVTLNAGAARTVMNTTNGYYFQFLTTVPSGGVLVDVEARTATAITGGADMSANLHWAKAYPMQFEAGSNTLTTDASSFSVSYQPAYL